VTAQAGGFTEISGLWLHVEAHAHKGRTHIFWLYGIKKYATKVAKNIRQPIYQRTSDGMDT